MDIKELLRDRNLKATPTRLALLNLMNKNDKAISFSKLQTSLGQADRSTVFRTLNVLLESGIIHKTHFQDADTYYAMCPSTCTSAEHLHEHAHFRCTSCDTVSCETLPEGVVITIPGLQVEQVNINVTGLCSLCFDSNDC